MNAIRESWSKITCIIEFSILLENIEMYIRETLSSDHGMAGKYDQSQCIHACV